MNRYVGRSVEDKVLIVAIVLSFVVAWIVSYKTRPFLNPDEGAHFFRAIEISHGHLINFPAHVGIEIPCSEYFVIGAKYRPVALYQNVLLRKDFNSDSCRVKTVNTAGIYSPVPYLFISAAELVVRQFNWSVENRLIAMRFSNFIGTTAICVAAFYLLSSYRAPFVLIGLSPLVFWLRASVSADGVTISLSMLFLAYTLSILQKMRVPNFFQWSTLIFLAMLVGSCKPVYALICFASLLFWLRDWGFDGGKLKLLTLSLLPGFAALGVSVLWTALADPALVYLGNSAEPKLQLLGMMIRPDHFILAVLKTIVLSGWDFIHQLWVPYTQVSDAAGATIATLLTVLFGGIVGSSPVPALGKAEQVFCLMLGLFVCLMVIVPLYLTYTPLNFPSVLGLQGRYFIPPIMLLSFGVAGRAQGFLKTSPLFREASSSIVPLASCIWLLLNHFFH